MTAKRITFSIADEDKEWLDAYIKVQQISLSEAVRQGIYLLKKEQRQNTYQRLVESTCGIWKKGDGLAYQEKLRGEWE